MGHLKELVIFRRLSHLKELVIFRRLGHLKELVIFRRLGHLKELIILKIIKSTFSKKVSKESNICFQGTSMSLWELLVSKTPQQHAHCCQSHSMKCIKK